MKFVQIHPNQRIQFSTVYQYYIYCRVSELFQLQFGYFSQPLKKLYIELVKVCKCTK
jgi:hypothetical protein